MSKKQDGGPAFPQDSKAWPIGKDVQGFDMYAYSSSGMSLRDYFAAKAMHAMLNNDIRREEMATVSNVARDAYRMADAMLAERDK